MLIKLAWRNIWRNKKRSFITITAIVVAVFLAILMRSMQLGMYDNMIQNVVGSYSGHVQIHSNGFWEEGLAFKCGGSCCPCRYRGRCRRGCRRLRCGSRSRCSCCSYM